MEGVLASAVSVLDSKADMLQAIDTQVLARLLDAQNASNL